MGNLIINNAFNTDELPARFRVKFDIYWIDTDFNVDSMTVWAGPAGTGDNVYTSNITEEEWHGVDFEVVITEPNKALTIEGDYTLGTAELEAYYIRNFEVIIFKKAEVQDTDMRSAGRRTSYYEGTKMTSADFNIDSPDTVDGGPVVVINTVDGDELSSTPHPQNIQ